MRAFIPDSKKFTRKATGMRVLRDTPLLRAKIFLHDPNSKIEISKKESILSSLSSLLSIQTSSRNSFSVNRSTIVVFSLQPRANWKRLKGGLLRERDQIRDIPFDAFDEDERKKEEKKVKQSGF